MRELGQSQDSDGPEGDWPWLGGIPGSGNDPSGCSDPCAPPLSPPPAHHGSAPWSQPRHLELGQTKGCREGQ